MIRKIILENYMAHVRTVIEPAAGLTVLIGPNNCGKSAIIHALEMICYNSDAASFAIRHGSKKAIVTIETQDPDGTVHTLVWWRKKESAGYIIDGREISGMGKGKIPEDLHRYLRMPEVRPAVGDPFRIHFGLQKQPIFLLDDPPSRAAQFFASSSDADRLMEMQRRHKQKETNAKRDKEKLDQEIFKLDQQLGELSPLTEISQELARVEKAHREIVAAENCTDAMSRAIESLGAAEFLEKFGQMRVNSLVELKVPPQLHVLGPLEKQIQAMDAAKHRAASNQARSEVLTNLKASPELRETSAITRQCNELARARLRFDRETERVRVTAPLRESPELGNVQSLAQTLGKLQKVTVDLGKQRGRCEVLAELPQPPRVEDPAALRQQIAAIAEAQEKVTRLDRRHQIYQALRQSPEEAVPKPLSSLVAQMEILTGRVLEAERILAKSQQKLTAMRLEIEEFVQKNPRCQSCGQSISSELIMAGASGGHDHG